MNQQTVRFITLRKTHYRDSDLIIQGLAAEGLFECIALGAKNSRKRFTGGVLEPVQYIKAHIVKSKTDQALWRIEEAQVVDGFAALRSSFLRLEGALHLVQWASQLSQHQTHHHELFMILGRSLRRLEQVSPEQIVQVQVHFLCHYLLIEGCLDAQDPLWSWSQQPLGAGGSLKPTGHDTKNYIFKLYEERLGLRLKS